MKNILLIEPNPILARTYARILQHAGHKVATVLSAQGAVEEVDARCPDVVVLELQLPMHGGVEFLYEFRSYDEWQQIPVILHTYTPLHILEPLRPVLRDALGVHAILYKPQTSLEQLAKTVRTILNISS